jgi:hypothetical protein
MDKLAELKLNAYYYRNNASNIIVKIIELSSDKYTLQYIDADLGQYKDAHINGGIHKSLKEIPGYGTPLWKVLND